MTRLIEVFTRHRIAANLAMIMMTLAGVWAIRNIHTQLDPAVNWPQIWISVDWPGASAEDVEQLVAVPIEQELRGLTQLREIRSTSKNVEQLYLGVAGGANNGQPDITLVLRGKDVPTLKQAAEELSEVLAGYQGVSNVIDDLPYGREQLIFALTPQGRALGLTTTSIGRQLRAAYNGERIQGLASASVCLPAKTKPWCQTAELPGIRGCRLFARTAAGCRQRC